MIDEALRDLYQTWLEALDCQTHELEFISLSEVDSNSLKEKEFEFLFAIDNHDGYPYQAWTHKSVYDRFQSDFPEWALALARGIGATREEGAEQ